MESKRPFLGLEHLATQGFHVFPACSNTYKAGNIDMFESLSDKALKEVAGNGVSLPAWGAWLAYVLSHTERTMDITPVPEPSVEEENKY